MVSGADGKEAGVGGEYERIVVSVAGVDDEQEQRASGCVLGTDGIHDRTVEAGDERPCSGDCCSAKTWRQKSTVGEHDNKYEEREKCSDNECPMQGVWFHSGKHSWDLRGQ